MAVPKSMQKRVYRDDSSIKVTPTEVEKILFHAYHNGFNWSDYGWISADNEILQHNLSQCASMNTRNS